MFSKLKKKKTETSTCTNIFFTKISILFSSQFIRVTLLSINDKIIHNKSLIKYSIISSITLIFESSYLI